MTPAAVIAHGLTKVYRLYRRPEYKLLDLVGLCRQDAGHYTEHVALNAIDLRIAGGEKVAIIGRNGAGKSTLLKLITGVLRPTRGEVVTHGTISNLLQIGTGFHPEFTGRQNVYASLAHQGITGARADRVFHDVLAFAEIEEYIDQPMKTYSTGMCSRLMFSSSIVLKPEILIIDEILGVGDAYFAHKSFQRMRQLCADAGATLVLVTHDIYSAMHLCDRFIWIDRGEIKFDGEAESAIALYETSIKEQEEHRLRKENASLIAKREEEDVIHVVFRTRTGFALPKPLAIERIVMQGTAGTSILNVADGAADWHLLPEGNLGGPQVVSGRRSRAIETHGSIYHKAEWIVRIRDIGRVRSLNVSWHYQGSEPIDVRVFDPSRKIVVAGELSPHGEWHEDSFAAGADGASPELEPVKQTDYGTGQVRIQQVEFLDRTGGPVVQVRHGDPLVIRVGCEVKMPVPGNAVTFVLGFARPGSPYAAHIYEPELRVPSAPAFTLDVVIDAVPIGSGDWFVTLGVGEANMFKRDTIDYFTIDSAWYHYFATRLRLQVSSASHLDAAGCFAVLPARVVINSGQNAPHVCQTS